MDEWQEWSGWNVMIRQMGIPLRVGWREEEDDEVGRAGGLSGNAGVSGGKSGRLEREDGGLEL